MFVKADEVLLLLPVLNTLVQRKVGCVFHVDTAGMLFLDHRCRVLTQLGQDAAILAAVSQSGAGIIASATKAQAFEFTLFSRVAATQFSIPFLHLFDGSIKVTPPSVRQN